jgi:hypothetical protein
MLLGLSPYGPAEIQEGASWTYTSGHETYTLRITDVSPREADISVTAEVVAGNERMPVSVAVSSDRQSLTARHWLGEGSGAEIFTFVVPELAPGVTWHFPWGDVATVTAVESLPLSTPAGDFPEAMKVSLQGEDIGDTGIVWLAWGVGILAIEDHGRREMELLDYQPKTPRRRPPRAQPVGRPRVMQAGPPPVVTVLDENTFVVVDPATNTVTVFHLVRSDTGEWQLEAKATSAYGCAAAPSK